MVKVILNVPELSTQPTFHVGTGKPPKKNKVTIKKMTIADPGIGVAIEIDWANEDEKVESLVFHFSITHNSNTYNVEWILTGDDTDTNKALYLPENEVLTYIFVFPFIDENFDSQSGGFSCTVSLAAHKQNGNATYPVTSENTAIVVTTEHTKTFGIESLALSPNINDISIGDIAYSHIYCHQEGIFWNETYTNSSPPTWIYLRKENIHDIWSGGKPYRGSGVIDDLSFCFIPYVRIGDGGSLSPAEFELFPGAQDQGSGHVVVDVSCVSPIPNGQITIGLVDN